jgi:hypothetical protein
MSNLTARARYSPAALRSTDKRRREAERGNEPAGGAPIAGRSLGKPGRSGIISQWAAMH